MLKILQRQQIRDIPPSQTVDLVNGSTVVFHNVLWVTFECTVSVGKFELDLTESMSKWHITNVKCTTLPVCVTCSNEATVRNHMMAVKRWQSLYVFNWILFCTFLLALIGCRVNLFPMLTFSRKHGRLKGFATEYGWFYPCLWKFLLCWLFRRRPLRTLKQGSGGGATSRRFDATAKGRLHLLRREYKRMGFTYLPWEVYKCWYGREFPNVDS